MLLLDLSAFARLTRPGLPSERTEQVARRMRDGQLGVCADYDIRAERSGLRFHSEWLAPRGSLA